MKLTNRLNLPQPIVSAVTRQEYSRGDAHISVTELIGPVQKSVLEREHYNELSEDVADRIFALLGTTMHKILQDHNSTGVAERRLTIEVEGWKLSGGMDAYYDHGLLQDYKLTSVYALKDGPKPEHVCQLNVYAEILRQHGHKVERLEIVGILRDWSQGQAERERAKNPNFPQQQVVILSVPVWTPERAQKYIRERVILHQKARQGDIAECTPDERWAKPEQWAVMRKGLKNAVRGGLYLTEAEANARAATEVGGHVQHRPANAGMRCKMYCAAQPFCQQYKKLTEAAAETVEEMAE